MFDEFLEDYKYNWKMADKKYMEKCYRKSLSPKQMEKAQSSPTTSILLRIKWALKNLKMRIEAARFPEILAIAVIVFSISLILLIVSLGWNILASETTLYRLRMTLYLVSGLLVLNLMPSTVAYNRKKYEKRSINDKHSMEEITKYFESVSVKALINTAEDFKIDLKNAVPWLILENQQYMKEKEKRQKENLLTQIVVTLLTITLSSVTIVTGTIFKSAQGMLNFLPSGTAKFILENTADIRVNFNGIHIQGVGIVAVFLCNRFFGKAPNQIPLSGRWL